MEEGGLWAGKELPKQLLWRQRAACVRLVRGAKVGRVATL